MLTSKKASLKPLLESADGLHLTLYLVNTGALEDLKSQVRKAIEQSHEWIDPVLTSEERARFLEPLHGLLTDDRILKDMKDNIGIFRNSGLVPSLECSCRCRSGLSGGDFVSHQASAALDAI